MNKKRPPWEKPTYITLGVVFFIAVWWILAASLRNQGSAIVLTPYETLIGLVEILFTERASVTYTAIGWTFARLLIGFAISFLLAAIFGTLGGLFPQAEYLMKPWIVFSRTIPTAAIVLILSALFLVPGRLAYADYIPSILTILVAYPLLYEAFVRGIKESDKEVLNALDLDAGRKSWKAVYAILWPGSLPFIEMAIAQSLGLSLKVTIMSEVLSANSATNPGLGTLIMDCQTNPLLRVEDILPYSVIALLLMFIIDIPLWILKRKKNNA